MGIPPRFLPSSGTTAGFFFLRSFPAGSWWDPVVSKSLRELTAYSFMFIAGIVARIFHHRTSDGMFSLYPSLFWELRDKEKVKNVTWKAKTDTNALPFNARNRLLSV